MGNFCPKTMTVVTMNNNLKDGFNRILFPTIFDFLVVPNAMVTNESDSPEVRFWCVMPELLKSTANLVHTSIESM
jgi:hypothetical protein